MNNENIHKLQPLRICNKVYDVSLYISINDVVLMADYQENYELNCDFIISTIIRNHIITEETMPSIEEIQGDQIAIKSYIEALIKSNNSIKSHFDELSDEHNIRVRLLKAINKFFSESMENSLQAIKAELSAITFNVPNLNQIAINIQKVFAPLIEITKIIGESVLATSNYLNSLFAKIRIPTISAEYKEQLRESFIIWGEFGWTMFPHASLDFYKNVPKSQKEANEKTLVYCRKEYMQSLFSDIQKLKGVKKGDFEEAVFDYNNHKYKSCAMILLSLIDAKLIRMQKKEDRKKYNGSRKNGIAAIKAIETHIEDESDINSTLLFLLSYSNLFACLKAIFEYGDDFKNQPNLPNRNFIGHGMLTRKVLRRDCIQLFLLYYNLLEFIDILTD